MSYIYMLNTNIVSDMICNPMGKASKRFFEVEEADVCISVIVACELRFGTRKRGSVRLNQKLERVLRTILVEPLKPPVENYYAEIRTYLESARTLISANDMLIAAHALSLDTTIVTANVREFSRVPNLRVENWL